MKYRKGFTLIELMVVVLIVGILASVAVPFLKGRIDSAKWAEGKAIMGSISVAIRAYSAGVGDTEPYGDQTVLTPAVLGFIDSDISGTYFNASNFSWTASYSESQSPPLQFTITATAGPGINTPASIVLDHTGKWTEN